MTFTQGRDLGDENDYNVDNEYRAWRRAENMRAARGILVGLVIGAVLWSAIIATVLRFAR